MLFLPNYAGIFSFLQPSVFFAVPFRFLGGADLVGVYPLIGERFQLSCQQHLFTKRFTKTCAPKETQIELNRITNPTVFLGAVVVRYQLSAGIALIGTIIIDITEQIN
jgi:hypothetical protein